MADKKKNNAAGAPKPQPPIPPQPPVTKVPPRPAQPTTPPRSNNTVRAATPGWNFQPGRPGTMAAVSKIVNSRVIDASKIYNGGVVPGLPKSPSVGAAASNTVEGAPSIVEQARALKNDAQLIYEFCYDNIDWQPGWGLTKGALGTFILAGSVLPITMVPPAICRTVMYMALTLMNRSYRSPAAVC